jgi:RsiW-degrading membrane proteinase PrsW (M82 family)
MDGTLNERAIAATGTPGGRWMRIALASVAVLIAAALLLATLLYYGLGAGIAGSALAIFLAVLPVPLYVALALWLDRYEKEPVWMLLSAFVWGATISFVFALLNVIVSHQVIGAVFNESAAGFFATVISAPIVEETMKGLALLILFLWKKDEFDGVLDGIIYAAMVGLGFAMVENFGYYASLFAQGGVAGSLMVFVVRGVLSPFGHPIFTAMTGMGLGLARRSNKLPVKLLAPVVGLMAAMSLHSLWNFTGVAVMPRLFASPDSLVEVFLPVMLMSLVLGGPAILLVLVVAFFSLRREGQIVRRNLLPELQYGLLTQQEYDSLGSVGGRMGSSLRSLRGGLGAWRRERRLHQTASELAFHRDRVGRGISSERDQQREAAYVQELWKLRPVGRERGR